jgi:hypothetical protein
MIERIEGAPQGVLAFKAVGEVHAEDYDQVLKPAVDEALAGGGKLRVAFELGPDFDKYSAGAAWDDAALGFSHLRSWERCAIITDHDWLRHAAKAFGWMMPGELRVFAVGERDAAMAWAAEN